MSISWLMIFLLLTDFILINSDRSSVNSIDAENKGTDADAKDINLSNTGSNSLFKFNDFEASMETQKIPIFFSQKTKRHQEDEGMFSRRMDYLIDALSKIAKVQSFEKDPASVRRLANHL